MRTTRCHRPHHGLHNTTLYVGLLMIFSGLALTSSSDAQVTRYVAPDGVGDQDGSSWEHAYGVTDLQTAVDAALVAGSIIYLKAGSYDMPATLDLSGAAGLTLSGGWAGNDNGGLPGDPAAERSALTRGIAGAMRIITATGSTLVLKRLTITDGYLSSTGWNAFVHGAGLELTSCHTVFEDCRIVANVINGTYRGIGIYAAGGSLTLVDCDIADNHDNNLNNQGQGVGLHAASVTLNVTNTIFSGNMFRKGENPGYGAGIYLTGGSAWLEQCEFIENRGYGDGSGAIRGGAIWAGGNFSSLTITNGLFRENALNDFGTGSLQGGVLYITGSGETRIADSRIDRNTRFTGASQDHLHVVGRGGDDIYLNVSGTVTIENSEITGGMHRGIYKTGTGSLILRNTLVGHQGGHGVDIANGDATILNSTIAGNGGWGVQSAQDITMTDSIVWDNLEGLTVGGGSVVTYSCIQGGHAGAGNLAEDPLFMTGYYLARDGLPFQDADSPCLGQGSATAETLGLAGRTTRTDGATASGTVDMGYHYPSGISGIDNLVLHVDVHGGNDGNDGLTSGTALATLSAALEKAIAGSVINIATGTYSAADGETFPLELNAYGLTLRGTDPLETIIKGNASVSVLRASGVGPVTLEGLTFREGRSREGAGLFLLATHTRIINCIIRNNTFSGLPTGAITLYSGRTEIRDSMIRNHTRSGQTIGCALFAYANTLSVVDSQFLNNTISHNHNRAFGGAMFIQESEVVIQDSVLEGNAASHGGGVFVRNAGVSSLSVSNSAFSGNVANAGTPRGGVISFETAEGTMTIADSVFSNNFNAGSVEDIRFSGSNGAIDRTIMTGGSASGIRQTGASSSLGITNCLIYNQPDHGINVTGGSTSVANTTLADNGGWGLSFSAVDLDVENTIAWGNVAGGISATASGSAMIIYTASQEAHPGDGNLVGMDPLFVDSASGNYRLVRHSPCVDAGINRGWMVDAVDLQGNKRMMFGATGMIVDMGPYELLSPSGSLFLFK